MKEIFLKVCYIANIALIIIMICMSASYLLNFNEIYEFFFTGLGAIIRSSLSILAVILWIYCIYIWSAFDKRVLRLFFLLIFSCFYMAFYFRRINKEGWK